MAGYILKKVKPEYPKAAKQAHISGTVILQARIGTDGTIQDLKVVSGPFQLLDATMHAVRQWTYKPYMVDGKPVAVETKIAVHYNLRTADADDY
jgi:TonB family protein